MSREAFKIPPHVVDGFIDMVASSIPNVDDPFEEPTYEIERDEFLDMDLTPLPLVIKSITEHLRDHLSEIVVAYEKDPRITADFAEAMLNRTWEEIDFFQNLPQNCNMSRHTLESRHHSVINCNKDAIERISQAA
jgi:hypothetical protein